MDDETRDDLLRLVGLLVDLLERYDGMLQAQHAWNHTQLQINTHLEALLTRGSQGPGDVSPSPPAPLTTACPSCGGQTFECATCANTVEAVWVQPATDEG